MSRPAAYCLIALALLLGSCALQPPTFQRIDPPAVQQQGATMTVSSRAHFRNPNKKGLYLKGMELQMLSNGQPLGTFVQEGETPIAPQRDFDVPFSISFGLKALGSSLWATALSAAESGKIKLTFRGYARVGGKKRGIKIPIVYTEKIDLR
jgi:LEA14-like dessication related protein